MQGIHTDDPGADALSQRVIGCAFSVLNTLGSGFLEKVYENALAHELRKSGLPVTQQHSITVTYDGIIVGEYTADLLVNQILIVELKTTKALNNTHAAQCLNYLKATGLHTYLLLNFGRPRLEIRRLAH
jgi:GxxExxY protein